MRLIDYLKDKSLYLFVNILIFVCFVFLARLLDIGNGIIVGVCIIWFIPLITYILIEYLRVNKFFKDIQIVIDNLEERYLVAEIVEKPSFIEGIVIYEIIREANKDMHEKVKFYREKQNEYKEYIDMWVHEIKTPIAAGKLIIENDKNVVTNQIDRELSKIDKMVEQVLYYSKMDEANEDYKIKNISIQEVIEEVIKNNSMDFILKRIKLNMKNLDVTIFSDKKWLEFILNQILGNALKYTKENGEITIEAKENKSSIELAIKDNGVGIPERDIKKVFLKGYTGENGRIFGKSTGMGLYICKNLCKKLNLGLKINSIEKKGTTVVLVFSKGENTNLFE